MAKNRTTESQTTNNDDIAGSFISSQYAQGQGDTNTQKTILDAVGKVFQREINKIANKIYISKLLNKNFRHFKL